MYDIENAKEDIVVQPMYISLNLCRVLAFLKDNLYLSKEEGGKWGINHLPDKYKSLIYNALECYKTDKDMSIDLEEAIIYAEFMLNQIKKLVY
jgi:streptomycin 3"-adenylyltransferase